MLDKNIVRINGYKGTKRTHVDVEVKLEKLTFTSDGRLFEILTPASLFDPVQVGFDNGLDAVTSVNRYNCFAKKRLTEKIS